MKETGQIEDKTVIRPIYKIGQSIFHIAPESDKGVIVDWSYRKSTDLVYYNVSLGFNDEIICMESELSTTKTF